MTTHIRRATAESVPPSKPAGRRDRASWTARFADSPTVTIHHSETSHAKPTDTYPGRP